MWVGLKVMIDFYLKQVLGLYKCLLICLINDIVETKDSKYVLLDIFKFYKVK